MDVDIGFVCRHCGMTLTIDIGGPKGPNGRPLCDCSSEMVPNAPTRTVLAVNRSCVCGWRVRLDLDLRSDSCPNCGRILVQ
jgi:hypothetical protein